MFSFFLLSSLALSDANVYKPQVRALLGTAVYFCKAVVPKLITVPIGTADSSRRVFAWSYTCVSVRTHVTGPETLLRTLVNPRLQHLCSYKTSLPHLLRLQNLATTLKQVAFVIRSTHREAKDLFTTLSLIFTTRLLLSSLQHFYASRARESSLHHLRDLVRTLINTFETCLIKVAFV